MNTIGHLVRLWPRIQSKIFTLLISPQFRKMGAKSWVCPPFAFDGLGEVVVEDDVGIARDCWITTIGKRSDHDIPKLIIGAHSRVGRGSIIGAGKSVILGEYVLMAPRVYICDHTHIYDDTTVPVVDQDDRTIPVSIGRGSWLGINVVVMPGVTIGEHCVIGANSVVNSSIPDFSVAVGAPARVVRQYNERSARWEKKA